MIVVTGTGIVSAIGTNTSEVANALLEDVSGIAPVSFLQTQHRQMPVGEVKLSNEQLAQRLGIVSTDNTSRTMLLGTLALREALAMAGIKDDELEGVALVSGTTVADMDCAEQRFDPRNDHVALGDCGRSTEDMAQHVGRFGFVTTCSTACSSAANAFILGANLLRSGRFKQVVVGGTECLSRFHFNGFRSLMILDGEPCRPFDAMRAGLNLGEGAAFVVLETAEHAAQRGAKAMAQLSGWGNACDAFHQTASSDDGIGAVLSMRQALQRAGLKPADIQYVNAHGTGTPNNDASESEALHRVFGETMPPVSSTKSRTGHTTSASGSIEAVICLLAMRHGFIPSNLNWHHAMDKGIVPVAKTLRQQQLQHVLCNSFGFGGNDTSLVFSALSASSKPWSQQPLRPVYVKTMVTFGDIPEAELPRIPPLVARRLSGVLKRALLTSLVALQRSGIQQPQAIITGTAMGCVVETEKFLTELATDGEGSLKPTNFIHSTHNTISSLIAIHTHCHSYNSTYAHGQRSLESALTDAWLQITLGDLNSALVGWHDEADQKAVSFVLTNEPEGAVCTLHSLDDLQKLCCACLH